MAATEFRRQRGASDIPAGSPGQLTHGTRLASRRGEFPPFVDTGVVPVASKPAAAADAPKKKSKLPLIIGALVLLGAGVAGGWFFQQRAGGGHAAADAAPAGEHGAAAKAKAGATYFALDPAFVVNLADTDATRYLQADVQVMTRDPETLKALQDQAPAIRNRLLLLFGQQTAAGLAQRSGKERLQDAALVEVKKVLAGEGGPNKPEAVLFTSLVVQ
ncbi:flagellar basal body-associated FliL family protein [Pseudoxanthomonas sp. X-1]|nr:flagellar basal body-associated FliL family protein [Pseudoxanthomonas sp. X-1]UAY74024.1 flagellar basal body-associated FliL family protein [Pseudoxanthomonas sp. X-1]